MTQSTVETKPNRNTTQSKNKAKEIELHFSDAQRRVEAASQAFAVIEFSPDGTIVSANENFLKTFGYTLAEVEGRHHRMFVSPEHATSLEYQEFWARLQAGRPHEGQFQRFGRDQKEIWIQASYLPLRDDMGQVYRIIKFASDITSEMQWRTVARDSQRQTEAIGAAQAVIEFEADGTILTANQNFLNALGYSLGEIQGQHHRLFVDKQYAASDEYREFWNRLGRGEAQAGEYRRIRKDGREIWIRARYSPLLDEQGKVYKVVKHASDVTEERAMRQEAVRKSTIVENVPINILVANREGIISYANPASLSTLRKLQHVLPINVDEVVGSSYDIFHKNPSHQRNMLSDPKNLPHSAVIQIEDEYLKLDVSAIYDDNGNYTGPMVAWWVLTEQKKAEQREEEHKRQQEEQQKMLRAKVDELLGVVKAAADGDLTRPITVTGEDAVGELAEGLGVMLADLRQLISEVVEGSAQFTEGSRVVAESAQTLAEGAQSQSASVEEMSAAIEELARSIDAVKENAVEANRVACDTSGLAEEGGSAVNKSINAMKRIKASSNQISEIIQVISEIASQTNLLALNAAIEAARAGEHGMGFAVVADEVRKLAERSSEAAKEISTLIKESTQRVEEGAALSEQTGESLTKIIQGVETTAKRIGEIANATVEQSQNANEIANTIQQVSAVTEQTAAGSEEMASSSEELGAQATSMRELVSKFKLHD